MRSGRPLIPSSTAQNGSWVKAIAVSDTHTWMRPEWTPECETSATTMESDIFFTPPICTCVVNGACVKNSRMDYLSYSHNLFRTEASRHYCATDCGEKGPGRPVFSQISSVNWTQLFYSCVFMQPSKNTRSLWPGFSACSSASRIELRLLAGLGRFHSVPLPISLAKAHWPVNWCTLK